MKAVCSWLAISSLLGCWFGPSKLMLQFHPQSFTNCSCIPYPATATPGVCPAGDGCSQTRAIFFVLCFIFTFCTFLMQSPALQAVLRVVPFSKRPLAVGIKVTIITIIYSVLYHHECFPSTVLAATYYSSASNSPPEIRNEWKFSVNYSS